MRPLLYYIVVIAATVFIGAFLVAQNSKHVQIGYELNRLQRERSRLIERGRKLEAEVSKAEKEASLAATAREFRLDLRSPVPDGTGD